MSLTANSSLKSARRKFFMNSTYIMSRKQESKVFLAQEAEMSLNGISSPESASGKFSCTRRTSLPVTSGVRQGSILGPLLFLLYEDHLSNAVRTSNIATFADDTKIFRTINSNTDALALQTDLTNFEESSKNVNLKLNASKCKVLRVTRKHNKVIYPYKLSCETILTSTDCERDLGVLTSPGLSWLRHIDHQCKRPTRSWDTYEDQHSR